jgi:hypothetical protein
MDNFNEENNELNEDLNSSNASQNLPTIEIVVDKETREYFLVSAKWAKFISVTYFVLISLGVLFWLVSLLFIFNSSHLNNENNQSLSLLLLSLFSLSLVIFVLYLVSKLYRYSNDIKSSMLNFNQRDFNDSIKNLSDFFKFSGYAFIASISIYVVILIVTLIVGASKISR